MKKTAKKAVKKAVKRTRKVKAVKHPRIPELKGSECRDHMGAIKFIGIQDPVISDDVKNSIQESFKNEFARAVNDDRSPKDRIAESLDMVDQADLPEALANIIDKIMGRLKRDAETKREQSDIASKRFEEGLGIVKGIGR